ncbi:MAG: L,D-transpeptidase family protein [Bacteroidales bacterium]|nr:L,D-transpeptidase family protein [Bacteroidales bacterium]MDY0215708.1 L,D-transpeptidase family protein [Bacteroidales bacterium]
MKDLKFLLFFMILMTISCRKTNQDKDVFQNVNSEYNYIRVFCETDFSLLNSDFITQLEDLKTLYSQNNYDFLWFDSLLIKNNADTAIFQMSMAKSKGLDCAFYHLPQIKQQIRIFNRKNSFLRKTSKVIADLLLTDAYLNYCHHLAYGWSQKKDTLPEIFNFAELLLHESPSTIPSIIEPQNVHYQNYTKAWGRFYDNYNGFPKSNIPFMEDDSIRCYEQTIQRLNFFELLDKRDSANFQNIRNAIQQFQYLFGIESSGKPDSLTVVCLNKDFDFYHEQAMLTIEKLKHPDFDSIHSFILINIPTFSLFWIEQNELVSTHKVVTGTKRNPTPELTGSITKYTVLPDWNLPYSIATQETLPLVKRNINYLAKNKYIITNHQREMIDPVTINWSKLNRSNFPYRIVQTPGAHNALGLVKFYFNNSHDVYLHDTPQKRFFKRNIRAFSHGCMRLEKPFEFLKKLLEFEQGMLHYNEDLLKKKNLVLAQKKFEKIREGEENVATVDTVNAHLERKQQADFRFKKRIPLFVCYYSSFYDMNGNVLFYSDIYSKDEVLLSELRALRAVVPKYGL